MIVQERIEGHNLIKTYSDSGFLIRQEQTGIEYAEAVDIENSGYTYVETDIPIEEDELTDSEALSVIMGRDANESGDGE